MCLLGLICSYPCWAAYSDNIDDLYDELSTCVTNLASDIECVEAVQDGLDYMSDYADAVSATILLCTMLSCYPTMQMYALWFVDAILSLFVSFILQLINVMIFDLQSCTDSVKKLSTPVLRSADKNAHFPQLE